MTPVAELISEKLLWLQQAASYFHTISEQPTAKAWHSISSIASSAGRSPPIRAIRPLVVATLRELQHQIDDVISYSDRSYRYLRAVITYESAQQKMNRDPEQQFDGHVITEVTTTVFSTRMTAEIAYMAGLRVEEAPSLALGLAGTSGSLSGVSSWGPRICWAI
ncbi:MAG: hypothetical protein Q9222_000816 [Ikaeria aurantiellina]